MKILVIGAGGVGSYYVEELAKQIEQGQIEFDKQIDIADPDIVELEQLKYQNFTEKEVGVNKAVALAKRCMAFDIDVFKAIPKRIKTESQLRSYDFFVLCVDNEGTRELVIRYCHENGKEFIDLRATGRRVFCMPKLRTLEENLKFVDGADKREYSCQDKEDLERGRLQLGHKISAIVGVQMLLNFQRGHSNRTINMVV